MKSGILFSGYGSQWVGMGKELYDRERLVQEYFEEAATCLNMNFVKLCFASSDTDLAKISNAYTSLFLLGASSAGLLRSQNVPFELVGGTDIIGWYSSLFAAQSISLPDGLYILNKVAQLYEEFLALTQVAGIHVSGIKGRKLMELLADYPDVAIGKTDIDSVTFVGDRDQIEELQEQLRAIKRVKAKTSDLGAGLYTPAAEQLTQQVTAYLEKIDIKQPTVPLISPLTGRVVKTVQQVRMIAQTMTMQPFMADKVVTQACKLPILYLGVPSHTTRDKLLELRSRNGFLPETLITMETVAEFDAIVTRHAALAEVLPPAAQEITPSTPEEPVHDPEA